MFSSLSISFYFVDCRLVASIYGLTSISDSQLMLIIISLSVGTRMRPNSIHQFVNAPHFFLNSSMISDSQILGYFLRHLIIASKST